MSQSLRDTLASEGVPPDTIDGFMRGLSLLLREYGIGHLEHLIVKDGEMTDEETERAKVKMGESLFSSLVQGLVRAYELGLTLDDLQLALKVSEATIKER